MDRLVKAKVDIGKIDFKNESAFLKILALEKSEYLERSLKVKSAANRLILKYGITSEPGSPKCISCKSNFNEVILKLKEVVNLFKGNHTAFENFQSAILANFEGSNVAASKENLCCGFFFYACVTFCAASIEVFPVYLMCCALCFDTYCCKP